MDKNHNVSIAMDSCRYDPLVTASTPNIHRLDDSLGLEQLKPLATQDMFSLRWDNP